MRNSVVTWCVEERGEGRGTRGKGVWLACKLMLWSVVLMLQVLSACWVLIALSVL